MTFVRWLALHRRTEDRFALFPDRRVKTTAPARVTGRSGLFDQHQQAITITIHAHFHQLLNVAAGVTLGPKRLA